MMESAGRTGGDGAPWSTGWPAPAKLNLFLHIVGRRADAYHLLQTVFQLLDHGDTLDFLVTEDGSVSREGGFSAVPESADLTVRAARLLRNRCACDPGVRIRMHKKLPAGGGLGGGSSDAATTLVALNRLWGLGLSTDELAGMGLSLGADVPVFVHGRSAWAEGVGERLEALDPPQRWFVVVDPRVSVATADVFGAPELTRNSTPIRIQRFHAGETRNDCEPVVRARYAEVDRALRWLGSRGDARLTGTGGCVFAAFEHERDARETLAALPSPWQGFVARGVNESPLLARSQDEPEVSAERSHASR